MPDTVDTSIYQNVYVPKPWDPSQAIGQARNMLALQQEQKKIASQNALQQLFSNPGSLDADGNPSPQTIQKAMAIDPAAGNELRSVTLQAQVHKAQQQHLQTETGQAKWKYLTDVAGEALDAYTDAKKAGRPEPDAIAAAIKVRNTALDGAGGLLSPEDIDKARKSPFDPQGARALAMSNKDYSTRVRQERQDTERERHDERMEGLRAAGEARMAAALADREKAGQREILTDPSNNQQYVFDKKNLKAYTMSGESYTPGGAAKISSQLPGAEFSDSDRQFWANVLRNGGALPPGLARTAAGSKFVQELMHEVPKQAGSASGDYIANKAAVHADEGSLRNLTKMTDAATSFEATASKNFDLALKLAPKGIPTDWGPWINTWVEKGMTGLGDVDVPPYATAMLTAANEYAKIMSGSTGAQGSTVDSRREAAEIFSPYLNKGQIDRVVAVAKTDMANRKASLYGQVDEIKNRLRQAGNTAPTESLNKGSAVAEPPKPKGVDVSAAPAKGAPPVGTVKYGYRFKGGDPADSKNWEKAE